MKKNWFHIDLSNYFKIKTNLIAIKLFWTACFTNYIALDRVSSIWTSSAFGCIVISVNIFHFDRKHSSSNIIEKIIWNFLKFIKLFCLFEKKTSKIKRNSINITFGKFGVIWLENDGDFSKSVVACKLHKNTSAIFPRYCFWPGICWIFTPKDHTTCNENGKIYLLFDEVNLFLK